MTESLRLRHYISIGGEPRKIAVFRGFVFSGRGSGGTLCRARRCYTGTDGAYYFRRKIPLELIEQHNGKREIIRSLGTKNRAEAERLSRWTGVRLNELHQLRRDDV